MKTLTITDAKSSITYSKLAFGTGYLGYLEPKQAYAQLDEYVALGGRTIDTARIYSLFSPEDTRSAEKAIGEWLALSGMRKEVQIATKGGHHATFGTPRKRLHPADLQQDIALSLEDLQADQVELYFLHRDDTDLPVGQIMETLHDFVKQGMVRQLGASNWSTARILEANQYATEHGLTPFAVSQIQWSYATATPKDMQDETLICMNDAIYQEYQEYQIPVFSYESQSKGFFSKLQQMSETELPDKVKARFLNPSNREENLDRAKRVFTLCEKYNVSPAVIALSYLTSNPLPNVALIGCSNIDQLRDSMAAQDFTLTPEDFTYLCR